MSDVIPISRAKRARKNTEAPAPDGAIVVDVDVHRVVDECVSVIARDASIYQRDGQLVHVVHTAESEADALTLAGTPVIRPLQPATLLERLTRGAAFVRRDGRSGDWSPVVPTMQIVSALAARGQWQGVRPIVGVLESPSLRPDGSVLQTPGYDPTTGYLYEPNATFPAVPTSPTRQDARDALAELLEPFAEFPHASPEHRAVSLSAVLSVVARPAIAGNVPAHLYDASTRGSGKTLQTDACSTIATGRTTSKMGYPGGDDELEKVMGAYAMRGATLINFDNVTRPFGGGPIDRVLTAGERVELRVLGRTEIATLPWYAVILATGNNMELHGDTARRVLVCRLESPLENPEERTGYRHHPLLPWIAAERPRLVVAALTILRAYIVAGRPDVGVRSWGSFESWSALVPAALVWAGAADPTKARPSVDLGKEPEKMAHAALLDGLPRIDPGAGLTAKDIIAALYPAERLRGTAAPDGHDDLREAIETITNAAPNKPPNSKQLGYALRRVRDRVVGGRKVIGAPDRNGIVRWRIETAGDAGNAGNVPTLRAEDGSGETSLGGTTKTSPACPAYPAGGDGR